MADNLNLQFLHPITGAIGGLIVAPDKIPGGRPAAAKLVDERRAIWTMQVPTPGAVAVDDGGVIRAMDEAEFKAWNAKPQQTESGG